MMSVTRLTRKPLAMQLGPPDLTGAEAVEPEFVDRDCCLTARDEITDNPSGRRSQAEAVTRKASRDNEAFHLGPFDHRDLVRRHVQQPSPDTCHPHRAKRRNELPGA